MHNTPINTDKYTAVILPVTVRNIREAAQLCHEYDSVLTAGPDLSEVRHFGHPDHKVVSFDDITGGFGAPTYEHVAEMLDWGKTRNNILVHCHAGISRSTATAWGISIAHGHDPKEAIASLYEAHPVTYGFWDDPMIPEKRTFSPNRLIVNHIEKYFGFEKGHLARMLKKYPTY